jgi:hypothetical protein
MPPKTLRRKKTGSPEGDESWPPGGQPFRVLFIWMSGPPRDPMVRVLLVGTRGAPVVYEGMKPWSKCKRWIGRLRSNSTTDDELTQVCETFVRTQFATIQEAQASLEDLKSFGLRRADG